MPEDVARCVLRARAAEMGTDAAEHRGGEFLAVAGHRQAAQHLDAVAMQQLCLQGFQVSRECGQGEISGGDLAHVAAQGEVMPRRVLQLGNVVGRQVVQPVALVLRHVRAEPCRRAGDRAGQVGDVHAPRLSAAAAARTSHVNSGHSIIAT